MNSSAAQFLLSPQGREIIAVLGEDLRDILAAGARLRKLFPDVPPASLAAAVELAEAREHGRGKFARAEEMFFTREALEQATGEETANHRAERFRGLRMVCDACCGIGGDAIALGTSAEKIICVDNDPARLLFCAENLRLHGIKARIVEGDILSLPEILNECDALFIDPSRRSGGRRTLNPFSMSPPLDRVEELLAKVPGGAAKLPTSIREKDLSVPHELEWVSTAEGLKEAVLWTGNLSRCAISVSLLHRKAVLNDTDLPREEAETSESGDFLYEPDHALIRSGLLGRKAASLGMNLLSREIAYTTSDSLIRDDFFRGYRVLSRMKFSMKRLSEELNSLGIGQVTVKKRGFPMLPEEVIKKLKLRGSGSATVLLTRMGRGHEAFIVEQVDYYIKKIGKKLIS
jgi:hypothetical protein